VKLRIKGSSIRLRLTQGEMRSLSEAGTVEETVPFPGSATLTYRLRRGGSSDAISASYRDNVLEILVPEALGRQWCETDLVTLAQSLDVPGGELRITLEKDFACLAPREEEDESDNFPHPGAATGARC
jgi:hypothetical protein